MERGPEIRSKRGRADLDLDADEEIEYLSRRTGKRVVKNKRHLRLPHVLLSASLEELLMLLWNNKTMIPFQYPVDATRFPNYYRMIENPISLMDMRNKLGSDVLELNSDAVDNLFVC